MKEVKGTLSHVRVTYRRARRWALRAHLGRFAPGPARITKREIIAFCIFISCYQLSFFFTVSWNKFI